MKIYEDISASEFRDRAWSGAADTLEDLTDEQVETIFAYLEDTEGDEGMSLTGLNDFFWFERETIAEWLGYSSYDQLMERGDKGDEYFDDLDYTVKISHGTQGVDDNTAIEDYLYDAKAESNGDYNISDDEEDYSDEDDIYIGYVIADVSEAVLDWLKDNGIDFEDA